MKRESVQSQYDWSTRRPSVALIEAISVIENVEPTDLPVTLSDHIDPEALNALTTNDSRVTISFLLDEYRVHVNGDGLVITYPSD